MWQQANATYGPLYIQSLTHIIDCMVTALKYIKLSGSDIKQKTDCVGKTILDDAQSREFWQQLGSYILLIW